MKKRASLLEMKISTTALIIHAICLTVSAASVIVAIISLYMRKEAATIVINERLIEPLMSSENYIAFGAINILLLTMTITSFLSTKRAEKANKRINLAIEEKQNLKSLRQLALMREDTTKRLADKMIWENKRLKEEVAQLKKEIRILERETEKKEVQEQSTDLREIENKPSREPRNKRIAKALEEASLTR